LFLKYLNLVYIQIVDDGTLNFGITKLCCIRPSTSCQCTCIYGWILEREKLKNIKSITWMARPT